jgi:hypothetical protein
VCLFLRISGEGLKRLSVDLCRIIVEDFLRNSWPCVEALVKEAMVFKGNTGRKVSFFSFTNGQRTDVAFDGNHFFLRSSVEYSNPQLTVEEVQGIVSARLLEVCGNHFCRSGLHSIEPKDVDEICQCMKDPVPGKIVSFLLNTDDIEADRYSMNPLRESVVNSGQSAFPAAFVKTESLEIDERFAEKYRGSLICPKEIETIRRYLKICNNSYMDLVDLVKYDLLANLSKAFNIDLCLYSLRMPLSVLKGEAKDDLIHHIVRQVHESYDSFEQVYRCMGRSMKNLTTLLTIPHSSKGYGSKRVARGRIYFDGAKLRNVKVDYRTALLYPNAIDPADVSVARAEDSFVVDGSRLIDYSFAETPSSPQFFLYSLASPENAVLWHGIGAFGASELLKSYTTTRAEVVKGLLLDDLREKYGVEVGIPLQFNLVPKHMWFHPVHRNIDASIGCVDEMKFLADLGMRMEHLSTDQFIRKQD